MKYRKLVEWRDHEVGTNGLKGGDDVHVIDTLPLAVLPSS